MIERHRFDGRLCWIVAAVATASALLFVALASQLPMAIMAGAGHDDAWFWLRAQAIADGDWLGRYDQSTLMKGAGYPLFLAFNHALGLSLATTQALFYAGACLLFGTAVYRMSGRPWLALALVLAPQWHPMALAWGRIVRDNIYAAQSLLVLGGLLQCLFVAHARKGRCCWAALAGAALAWFWTTREDGIWLLPGVAIVLLARLLQAWPNREARRHVVVVVATMAVAFAGGVGLVATANGVKYGEFATVDIKESSFKDAISALQRVRVGDVVPHVPVPHKVREAVYGVSPAFARLRPNLEGTGRHWTKPGCAIHPRTCGDYGGGWFLWALRDAVAEAGEYATAPQAEAFYRRVAEDIGSACADGRLVCEGSVIGLMPPVTGGQWRTMPSLLHKAAALLVWKDVAAARMPSHLDHPAVGRMWAFVGKPRVPERADALGLRVAGWFHDPQGGWIALRCGASDAVAIARQPSPDIAAHFEDPGADRNRFSIPLPAEGRCVFEAVSGHGRVALADLGPDARHAVLGSGQLYLDAIAVGIPPQAQAPPLAGVVKQFIGAGYAAVLPWLAGAGLLAFLWASGRIVLRRSMIEPVLVLACAAWCLVACRAALLALVEMSSFPAINVQYMQPAFPLLVVATILSLAVALRVPASTRRGQRAHEPASGAAPADPDTRSAG